MVQWLLFASVLFSVCACQSATDSPLFVRVDAGHSGLTFSNTIQEDEQLNVLEYQYLYNGGGVAIGDVNNDGLPDLYVTGNQVPNRLYLNKGNLTFEDITDKAGVSGRKKWKTGTSMVDVNADGLLDIYVCYSGPGTDAERRNELYINQGLKNGVPVFREQAAQYGLDAPGTFSTQATFFDMDHDNDLDVFMVNHGDMFYNAFYNTTKLRSTRHPKFGNRLYRNDQGHFTDVSAQAGINGSGLNFGLSASIGDINGDNWPDIYVTNDYNEQDFLYLNQQNGQFREVAQNALAHQSKFSMGSTLADVNNDLKPDLITLDMLPEDNHRQKLLKGPDDYDAYQLLVTNGFQHQYMRNMLQLNMGNDSRSIPQFSEIGQLAGISNTDWSWSPLAGDFDNDGRNDLYVTNGYLRDFTNMDFLKFTYQDADQSAKARGEKLKTWQLVQQMPSTKTSNYCFSNQTTPAGVRFDNVTQAWGLSEPSISTGAAYGDLDNDGDLDLVINNSNDPLALYENKSRQLTKNHYLSVRLRATSGQNKGAIGAKVILTSAHSVQMRELNPVSSFQSSNDPVLHFGLGADSVVHELRVIWPDNQQTRLTQLQADSAILVTPDMGITNKETMPSPPTPSDWFTDVSAVSNLDHTHQESAFVDFKHQSLLPYQVSKRGPFLAEGDVNGDGLGDVFVGGNSLHPGTLLIQQASGRFTPAPAQPWSQVKGAQNRGSTFFDADGDCDLDLFIVEGGVEWATHSSQYQDQLYLNNGKGLFSLASNALPDLSANGSCVAAADYDRDGDLDLFIGGHSLPDQYPETDFSYVLRNESQAGKPRFVYASELKESSLRKPGLVNSAVWADLNRDGWPDLIVAGEFMPIRVYENRKGALTEATANYGLSNSQGFWNKLVVSDLNKDGWPDLVAGNLGLNTQFKASATEPLTVCYGDFDQNGTIDPLLCYYIQGKSYPLASLDELAGHMPSIKKKFLKYASYADATLDKLLTPEQLKTSKTLAVNTLSSSVFINNRSGQFRQMPLPQAAQVSPVSGIVASDLNRDGQTDLIVGGNFFPWRVQLGQSDSSFGLVCLGDGNGTFQPVPYSQTGLDLRGDVRDMLSVKSVNGQPLLLVTRNNATAGLYRFGRRPLAIPMTE
ncbi:VCBS repeat-containing protein [uncultured Spirosoma sp.]|uniref:VCBS repeat-containing protein n=1 Tax=uncultured Spirosoma sp. TaxID=278208 RepID=UPI00258CA445|nr:VCBS repeat-containing protein [uncultured Spirosoma sp.]